MFSWSGLLLEKEPNNFQSQSLNALIEKAVAKGMNPLPLSLPHVDTEPEVCMCRGIRWNGNRRRSCDCSWIGFHRSDRWEPKTMMERSSVLFE